MEKTLVQRGASVFMCEVYRRKAVSYSDLDIMPFGSILTSNSLGALESLLESLPYSQKVYNLVVPSKRIESIAKNFAFRSITNSGGASDNELYNAIMSLSGLFNDEKEEAF